MKKIYILLFALVTTSQVKAQLAVDLETGAAKFGYNDVRIPGNSGTLFSLADRFENKFSPYFRARLQYTFNKRHSFLLLYAPFTHKSEGILNTTINFQDELFLAGDPIKATWKFNSYRISYQYHLIAKEKFTFAIGLTGKVRDAKIALQNSTIYAEKTNLGFVPLIRFYADLTLGEKFHLIADGDALVAKQGRAEDVLFALGYNPFQRVRLKFGYRILEGGADNDEVYNFSSVQYIAVAAAVTF
ncbi:MAG TPA: hypothetical protein VFF27_17260 [Bacteroidia bacterium]|jgi:hypothetical protein|nr:hypothetical protein [Bacteroidia bacterium]